MIPEQYKNYMFNETDFFNEEYKCEDPEKEALVKELANMITDDIQIHKAEDVDVHYPDFWILDRLLTKEQVRFMLSFKKKRTVKLLPEQMAERNNMTPEEAEKMAFDICEIGLMEFDRENPEKRRQYFIPKWVVGSGEYMMMTSRLLEKHPEVATFFNYASSVPVGKVARFVPPGGGGLGMHVIPVEKAIEHESRSVSVEHLSHWLKKYDKYCVDVCTCRRQQAMRGEGVGDIEGMMCLAVGDMAEYLVETRKDAHYITYDEVMEILRIAEEKGYVHQITNLDGEDKIVGICNCSPGTCNALRTSQLFNTPNMSASAYRAHVDTEKCVACGKCVEVCPVGAAKLGQKLCLKDGSTIVYPKTELPDAQKWGPDKWNKNYREDSKINVYETGTAPCKTACPAHLAIQGYIKMASEGRYLDALKLIKQDNPFPAVCGAVCNKRCEERCTRGLIDEPIAIDEIKKFIAAQELNAETRYIPNCYNDVGEQWGDEYKVAIIGAGPAGLTAAFYLRKQGYPVTVFEKEEKPGGMLMYGIPNFRLEKKVIEAEIDVIRAMGAEIRCGVEVGKDVTIQELRDQGYKAFYLAIGMQAGRKANIPNEDYAMSGVDFLRKANALKDTFIKGKTVVIGGGNVAIDVARTAFRAGADDVEMYCLESLEEMPAAKDEIAEAKEEGVVIHNQWGPKEILAENGKIKGIVMKRCTRVYDENKKFNPEYDENELLTVECDNVILSIGQAAVFGDLLKDTKVEIRPNGTIIADPVTFQTAEEDIFVGGDIYHGARFAIDAIETGHKGMISINRFVHEGQSLTIGRDLREFKELDRDDVLIEGYDNAQRQVPGMKPGNAVHTYEDLRLPFTEEQIRIEAGRCLGCGASIVDTNRCIGCGLCTTRCEFDAIHLSRDIPEASRMYTAENGKLKAILPYMAKRAVKIVLNKNKK
ncbi:MAG: FAD-dependent oxidoreductase [Erysipelotrichaceae bacterium]|nr:FAD-dependent oxidoreductase [Erysipelotrichaceae bacterium]